MRLRKLLVMVVVLAVVLLPVMTAAAAPAFGPSAQRESVLIGFRGPVQPGLVRAHGGDVTREFQLIPVVAAELPQAAIWGLRHNPNIEYIEPNAIAHAHEQSVPWGVSKIGAPEVHAIGVAGTGVKVAVLDTGIDLDHPDLVVDGGSYFVPGVTSYDDDGGHGTHVAGTIAAVSNDYGVLGVAPEAQLYAVKVLDSSGSGSYASIIEGLQWAVENQMQVVNMSLGGSSDSQALEEACNNAYNAGVVIIASAGNSGNPPGKGDNIGYPAAYPSVIAVGATDQDDLRAKFSSTGPALEIMAPGVSVYSTYFGGGYATMSGTSMAAPHVSGVAALMLSADDSLTPAGLRQVLRQTAVELNDDPAKVGYGRVDALAAVMAVGGGGTIPNQAPVATFTYECTELSCDFDASGSSDSDGSIAGYAWDFHDGETAIGSSVSYTYVADGTYAVTLTVTDDDGATGIVTRDVAVSAMVEPPTPGGYMHIGDLDDDSAVAGKNWKPGVAVLVKDSNDAGVANATVTFEYTLDTVTGSASCVTDSLGWCSAGGSPTKTATYAIYTVTDVTHSSLSYVRADNEDPDPGDDSDGTTITINR